MARAMALFNDSGYSFVADVLKYPSWSLPMAVVIVLLLIIFQDLKVAKTISQVWKCGTLLKFGKGVLIYLLFRPEIK